MSKLKMSLRGCLMHDVFVGHFQQIWKQLLLLIAQALQIRSRRLWWVQLYISCWNSFLVHLILVWLLVAACSEKLAIC